jgi:hypothetical protein
VNSTSVVEQRLPSEALVLDIWLAVAVVVNA